jgi:hypothetical protein
MHSIFWLENLQGRDHVEDLSRWKDNTGIDVREIWWGNCIMSGETKIINKILVGNHKEKKNTMET